MVLIFGKNGQVATSLQASLNARGAQFLALGSDSVDFAAKPDFAAALDRYNPRVVINASAYTKVDLAESEPEKAFEVNANAVKELAGATYERNIPLVHFSTDYVYGTQCERAHLETDEPDPQNSYGKTKLEGENFVRSENPLHLILRVSWVYSDLGTNFVKTMLRLANERSQLSIVGDQIGAPISADQISASTLNIIDQTESAGWKPELTGTFNLTDAGVASWFDVAAYTIMRGGELGLCKRDCELRQITSEEYKTPAVRPRNSRMNLQKVCQVHNLRIPHWIDDLDSQLRRMAKS